MFNRRSEVFRDGKMFRLARFVAVVAAFILLLSAAPSYADNRVMGEVQFEGGQKQTLRVAMQRSAGWRTPSAIATLKLRIQPDRAAVFLDDNYVGHAGEFGGKFLIAAGKHRITVELPGYRTFETELNLLPGQKSEVKTELVKGSIQQNDAMIRQVAQQTSPNPR